MNKYVSERVNLFDVSQTCCEMNVERIIVNFNLVRAYGRPIALLLFSETYQMFSSVGVVEPEIPSRWRHAKR